MVDYNMPTLDFVGQVLRASGKPDCLCAVIRLLNRLHGDDIFAEASNSRPIVRLGTEVLFFESKTKSYCDVAAMVTNILDFHEHLQNRLARSGESFALMRDEKKISVIDVSMSSAFMRSIRMLSLRVFP